MNLTKPTRALLASIVLAAAAVLTHPAPVLAMFYMGG